MHLLQVLQYFTKSLQGLSMAVTCETPSCLRLLMVLCLLAAGHARTGQVEATALFQLQMTGQMIDDAAISELWTTTSTVLVRSAQTSNTLDGFKWEKNGLQIKYYIFHDSSLDGYNMKFYFHSTSFKKIVMGRRTTSTFIFKCNFFVLKCPRVQHRNWMKIIRFNRRDLRYCLLELNMSNITSIDSL